MLQESIEQTPAPLEFTVAAANKVRDLIAEEGNDALMLRVFVSGGVRARGARLGYRAAPGPRRLPLGLAGEPGDGGGEGGAAWPDGWAEDAARPRRAVARGE